MSFVLKYSWSIKYWVLWVLRCISLIDLFPFSLRFFFPCNTIHRTVNRLWKKIDLCFFFFFALFNLNQIFSVLLQPYSILNPNLSSTILHPRSILNPKPSTTTHIWHRSKRGRLFSSISGAKLKKALVAFSLFLFARPSYCSYHLNIWRLVTCTQALRLDLTDEFFQTVELLGQHSMEVLVSNAPFFSVNK